MKRIFSIILYLMLLLTVLNGCTDNSNTENDITDTKNDSEIVEIQEKMFITQIDDIYLNPDYYKGKIIKLEGMYDEYTDDNTNKTYYSVIRNAPGCCGDDGVAGFNFTYEGVKPEQNDWIAVEGTVEVEEQEDGYQQVTLKLSKLTVKTERGAEYVDN